MRDVERLNLLKLMQKALGVGAILAPPFDLLYDLLLPSQVPRTLRHMPFGHFKISQLPGFLHRDSLAQWDQR